MITVPDEFAASRINEAGEAGRAWIAGLPRLIAALCRQWHLVVDGPPMHGYLALVVPVRRGEEACALKVSWGDESTAHEIAALAAWQGQGAALLLEAAPEQGALLLERLDSRRSLHDLEVSSAVAIAGQLLRRLAVPAPQGFPLLAAVAAGLVEDLPTRWARLNRPLPRRLVDAAGAAAADLGPAAGALIVNYDLHDGNVLAGTREPWLAIDPKVVAGDPEYGVAQLLWRRLEDMQRAGGLGRHLQALVASAGLDVQRTRAWTLVRCVDYWLWALGVGLTEDPQRCAAITTWLAEGHGGW